MPGPETAFREVRLVMEVKNQVTGTVPISLAAGALPSSRCALREKLLVLGAQPQLCTEPWGEFWWWL